VSMDSLRAAKSDLANRPPGWTAHDHPLIRLELTFHVTWSIRGEHFPTGTISDQEMATVFYYKFLCDIEFRFCHDGVVLVWAIDLIRHADVETIGNKIQIIFQFFLFF
jgi:hypothetical protein